MLIRCKITISNDGMIEKHAEARYEMNQTDYTRVYESKDDLNVLLDDRKGIALPQDLIMKLERLAKEGDLFIQQCHEGQQAHEADRPITDLRLRQHVQTPGAQLAVGGDGDEVVGVLGAHHPHTVDRVLP